MSKLKTITIFPDTCSDDEIIEAIRKVGDSPAISTRMCDEATFHRKVINHVEIDVIKIKKMLQADILQVGLMHHISQAFDWRQIWKK